MDSFLNTGLFASKQSRLPVRVAFDQAQQARPDFCLVCVWGLKPIRAKPSRQQCLGILSGAGLQQQLKC